MTPAARIATSIELLQAVETSGRRPADAVSNDFFRARRFIGAGDRRAISDRVWGVLRNRRRLGWWIEYAKAPVTARMLLCAYLMMFENWNASGLVQTFSGGKFAADKLIPEELATIATLEGRSGTHPDMPRAVQLEVPDWILPLLEERFGGRLEKELVAMATAAPLDLRVNLLKGTREGAMAALQAESFTPQLTTLSPWGLRLQGRRPVTSGEAFKSGLIEIQDEGSQLVALAAQVEPGMRVADICAGAGGKTLAIAMVMQNKGHIAACDVSAPRLESAVVRLRRAGAQNVERHLFEAGDKWVKRRAGTFDRVLVDAPCTGTGTWRRNPDARLRTEEVDLLELVPKQAMILDKGAVLVKKGGRLIYATCSILPDENEKQIEAFLARNTEFKLVPHGIEGLDGPMLALTPAQNDTDGFFTAVLERSS